MVVCPCSRPRNPNANPTSLSLSLSLSLSKAPTKILPAALQAMASVRGKVSSSAMPQTSFSTAFSWLRSSMLLRSRIAICCTAARDVMAGPLVFPFLVPGHRYLRAEVRRRRDTSCIAPVAPLSTSIKVSRGSKFINHEGHEGTRRFKPLKFPSCCFVPLVVIALPYPPSQPVQPIPRILPACYPRTGDEHDLETNYQASVFDRPDRAGKLSAAGRRSRHPSPRSRHLPVSRHKFKQARPGRARTGTDSSRQKPQLAAR